MNNRLESIANQYLDGVGYGINGFLTVGRNPFRKVCVRRDTGLTLWHHYIKPRFEINNLKFKMFGTTERMKVSGDHLENAGIPVNYLIKRIPGDPSRKEKNTYLYPLYPMILRFSHATYTFSAEFYVRSKMDDK